MLTSVSIAALWACAPAHAQCVAVVSGGTASCTVTNADGLSAVHVVNENTTAQATYSITNEATLTPDSGVSYGNYGILLDVFGDDGTGSSPSAIAGGNLTVNNSGTITMTGTTTPGLSQGEVAGIRVGSLGGNGAEPSKNGTDGGRGGDGGTVNITNSAVITIDSSATEAQSAQVYGIYAFSEAGAGGNMNSGAGDQAGGSSGDAKEIDITNTAAINLGSATSPIRGSNAGRAINVVATGNSGGTENGNGGSGGTINITNSGDLTLNYEEIATGADGVHGIYASSNGGDGISSEDNSDPGGNGESGRPITITNTGDITIVQTGNDMTGESAGIYALSSGGDGGESSDKNVGGTGGGGSVNTSGDASVMTINMDGGTISVSGDAIRGIVTRSEGGVGGSGNGDSHSTGGDGGYGGQIQVNLTGGSRIETAGDEGYGILGQSVGGLGGGNAGTAGRGGDSGPVGVYATSGTSIDTQGDFAVGITLHSIGGGGGTGADFTRVLSGSGGEGGNGGDAGKVTITTGADLTTAGDHAYGLLAQSIGGSGGTGGISDGLILELGGDGGGGGAGGTVEINNTGSIQTSGDYAIGILGQSISGGGGAAGTAGGILAVGGTAGAGSDNTASAYVTNAGDITTTGSAAAGIVMQSIGGGGGVGGGAAGMIDVGGSGGAGGNGGDAFAYAVGGTIRTSGDHSYGLVLQSIGGGGGSGGDVIDVSAGVGLGIGGSGSGGGEGGAVCATNTYEGCTPLPGDSGSFAPQQSSSDIFTAGEFAHGVVVQSIGGGGGNGGDFEGASVASVIAIQVGGAGSAGGEGGNASAYFDNLTLGTTGNNAKGMIVQSIGGGGGNGGNSTAVNGITPLAFQVGGKAGGGNTGRLATVDLGSSTIVTNGSNSGGILAQSVGGGGGTGGAASGYDVSVGFTMDTAIGGNGGSGGNASTVSVTLDDSCIATGFSGTTCAGTAATALGPDAASSHGITAQSIGGGGGTGGTALADALTIAVPTGEGESVAVTGTAAIGGAGSTGGTAGAVQTTLTGSSVILTGGDGSHGILAQSVGGGGGDGGAASSLSGSVGVPNTTAVDFSMALGAKGGTGGSGNTVNVTLEDTAGIATYGANANGIVAQSIGGGGGDGGVGNATNDRIGRGINFSADIGLGGAGGSGGVAETVTVDLAKGSVITTAGSGSRGVVAQSIGGGGGIGQGGSIGFSASGFTPAEAIKMKADAGVKPDKILKFNASGTLTLNLGASGGSGNSGGQINVTTGGVIATSGDDADGVLVQSVGGGGGLGGSAGNDSANNTLPELPRREIGVDSSVGITASIGGKGGSSSNGGDVTLTHAGQVTTTGDFADGILVQSVGGGGGAGGAASNGDGSQTVEANLAVGGAGGAGGNGGTVEVNFNDGTGITTSVSTSGDLAHGVILQSIGGGGGQGAVGSAADSGGVGIAPGGVADILTVHAGISLGGGFGGSGGSSGSGGTVAVTPGSWVNVTTRGDDAYALMAQSIGAGGGYGGVGTSVDSDHTLEVGIDVTLGGTGGSAGGGGDVNIQTGGLFATYGDRAFGIVAQSIGGGGGIAGTGSSDSIASLSYAGADGNGGSGGTVFVDMTGGQLTTTGDGSHAIIAQSIGGGGGIMGDLSGPTLDTTSPADGTAGGNGSGDTVTVNVNSVISTSGTAAYGIIAQSIGGGGGLSGDDGTLYAGSSGGISGNGGDVAIEQAGTLVTSGESSIGIFGQSVGAESYGKVSIGVGGAVTGGSGEGGAGVFVSDGAFNLLEIGEGGSVSAGGSVTDGTSGYAVRYLGDYGGANGATLTIDNYGRLNGDVLLSNTDGDTAGTVNNMNGGTWTLETTAGAQVVNAGDIVITGSDVVAASGAATTLALPALTDHVVTFRGDFMQTETGSLTLRGDFSTGANDLVRFEGDAVLNGLIRVDARTLAKDRSLTVLSVNGDLTNNVDVADTPTVDYGLSFDGQDGSLTINQTRFGSAFTSLDTNQREVGGMLDRIFETDATLFGSFLADLSALSAESGGEDKYSNVLNSLTPGGAQAAAASQTNLAMSRMDGALFCQNAATAVLPDSEQNCGWFDIGGRDFSQSGVGGFDGTQYVVSGGARTLLSSDWQLGVAGGLESGAYEASDGYSLANGDTGYLAAAIGKSFGPLVLSGAVVASYGSYDLERQVDMPSYQATAKGSNGIHSYAARFRGSYSFEGEAGYIRPALDLDLVRTEASGYTETGAGLFNLQVEGQSQTAAIITPSVEFGRNVVLANGMNMLMFANLAYSQSNADDWTSTARLAMAPVGAGTFSTTVPAADQLGRVALGMTVSRSDTFEARVEYGGVFGDGFSSNALAFGLTTRF